MIQFNNFMQDYELIDVGTMTSQIIFSVVGEILKVGVIISGIFKILYVSISEWLAYGHRKIKYFHGMNLIGRRKNTNEFLQTKRMELR
ncbi:hypothetical protein CR513_55016, partial [Mucuna pruriens]